MPLAFVTPEWVARSLLRRFCSASVCLSSSSPWPRRTLRFATLQASGYTVPVSALIVVCGVGTIAGAVWVYSICIAAITAAICQSPEAHPDRTSAGWRPAAGGFYLLAGLFGGSITALMSAPAAGVDPDAGGSGAARHHRRSLFQAVHQASERDAAVLTFTVTASGVTLAELAPPSGAWCSAG